MDPISQSAFPMTDIAPPEPPVPQPPDVSDVQEFQTLYRQDAIPLGDAPPVHTFQGMLNNMIGGSIPGAASDNIFQVALSRLGEVHDMNMAKIETVIERIASAKGMTPQQLLEAQMVITDASSTLSLYQAFDKKTEEGIKALMTGQ
ncbi:MAG TPA: hypothetical protein VK465_11850 [Fibrobacteria bacterium]|nr:hypothetical protein [Fibrobacteria bacterium]